MNFVSKKFTLDFLTIGCCLVSVACVIEGGGTTTDTASSDPGTTTGNGTTTGDGTTTGTGSGGTSVPTEGGTSDSSGTGTGGSTGGSTGAPGGMCGWDARNMYYECGFEGEDPGGMYPIACPPGLVEGDPCGDVPSQGCCDADGDLWFCDVDPPGPLLVHLSCE